jgi:hypothetical protein
MQHNEWDIPCAFCKKIVFSIDMYHAVFEDAFPFVFHSRDLRPVTANSLNKTEAVTYLIICAKYDVSVTTSAFFRFVFVLSAGIVQITVDSLVVNGRRYGALRRGQWQ